LRESPGGEALNTVGEARTFIKNGVDGIIHIFPFTCMPENIALEALQKMSDDYSIPILSLSIDEHTSKIGLMTRLEAYIDILKRVKTQRTVSRTPHSSLLTPR
jgi:predicted nucleotide-binding protein (sugar kinase/HSP70/actin superfamily)